MSRNPAADETTASAVKTSSSGSAFRLAALAVACYALTSLVVWLGGVLGQQLTSRGASGLRALAPARDCGGFVAIAEDGYPGGDGGSAVAFFPAYPLSGRWLAELTDLSAPAALLLVSHAFLLASFVLLALYLKERAGGAPQLAEYTLLALGLFPLTFYFRMAGAESLFLFLAILSLYGMQRQWPIVSIALAIGLATAVRLVGVGLLAPFAVHVWRSSHGLGERAGRFAYLMPLAAWGLLAFMGFQLWEYGSATVFARSYVPATLHDKADWQDHFLRLASFEPVWSTFHPLSRAYWARHEPASTVLFSPRIIQAVFFALALLLIVGGALKRWLSAYEWVLALALLLIPYALRSPELGMLGAGRSVAVVFPLYLVLGQLLARAPAPLSSGVLAFSAFLLGTYSAFLAAGVSG